MDDDIDDVEVEEVPSRVETPEAIDDEEQINAEEPEIDEDEQDEEEDEESDEEEAQMHPRITPGHSTVDVIDRPGYTHGIDDAIEEIYVVPDDKRHSSSVLSVFELTEIISVRAAQISKGGANATMIDIPDGVSRSRDIAILELMARRCPLKVMRNMGRDILPSGKVKKYIELWSPNEMTHPTI
jgi:hypothetical protein